MNIEVKQHKMMPSELENELIKKFESRRQMIYNSKSDKKAGEMQAEFMLGAVACLDIIVGNADTSEDYPNGMSCISPNVMISIMRGEYLKTKRG